MDKGEGDQAASMVETTTVPSSMAGTRWSRGVAASKTQASMAGTGGRGSGGFRLIAPLFPNARFAASLLELNLKTLERKKKRHKN